MDVGLRIKNLRLKNYLTQEELADRSELTKGFISQVERNLTSPSVATLIDILEALGTNPADFFKESQDKIVFKEEDYFVSERDDNYKLTWIVPNAQKNNMEPIIIDLDIKSKTKTIQPFSGEVFGYILSGKIVINFEKENYEVDEHETFYFSADKSFNLENLSNGKSKILLISSPPSF